MERINWSERKLSQLGVVNCELGVGTKTEDGEQWRNKPTEMIQQMVNRFRWRVPGAPARGGMFGCRRRQGWFLDRPRGHRRNENLGKNEQSEGLTRHTLGCQGWSSGFFYGLTPPPFSLVLALMQCGGIQPPVEIVARSRRGRSDID